MSTSTKGLRDWIVQRVSAIYLALYSVLIFVYLAAHPDLQFSVWQHLFTVFWFQMATVLFLIALLLHAWIGIWTIITDYIKCPVIQPIIQLIIILALLIFFIWGMQIIWQVPLHWLF